MYCEKCGNLLNNNDNFCENCGHQTKNNNQIFSKKDKSNIGLNILSFFFPLVGFILFLCFNSTNPKKSKGCGIGALIGFITGIVLWGVLFILLILFSTEHNDYNENYYETKEEYEFFDDYYEYDDYNLYYFSYMIDYYSKLARGKYFEELYYDNNLTSKCYNIDELEENNYYGGSIQVNFNNNNLEIIIWLTNNQFYVDGINSESYNLNDIKLGNKVVLACQNTNKNNSL